jgi:hypothetical protein
LFLKLDGSISAFATIGDTVKTIALGIHELWMALKKSTPPDLMKPSSLPDWP